MNDLVIRPPGWRSSHSVRLIGLDPAGVPRDFGSDDIIPGRVRVTGIWQGETISVDDQGSVAYSAVDDLGCGGQTHSACKPAGCHPSGRLPLAPRAAAEDGAPEVSARRL